MRAKSDFAESIIVLRRDARFAALIKRHGPPDLKRGKNPFRALVRSIIHQQVSGAAAETIHARFLALFSKGNSPTPEMVCAMPVGKMRGAGLSSQKASYIKDLAGKFSDGTIRHRSLRRMESDDIIEHLTQVKGIGVWDRAHVPHLYAEAPRCAADGRPRHPQGFPNSLWAQRTTRPRADGETCKGLARACLDCIVVPLACGG